MVRLILKIAYILDSFVETLLLLRILLSVFKADMANTYIEWIFRVSDIFIAPFEGITASTLVIDNFEIVITPIIALAFYAIVAFILSELMRLLNATKPAIFDKI